MTPAENPLQKFVRDKFNWKPEHEQPVADSINQICEAYIVDSYLAPVLDAAWIAGGENAAEVGRQIGVDKSTTSRWPWPGGLPAQKETDRSAKPKDTTIPSLRQYSSLFVGYGLDPVELLPHGRDVAWEIWRNCFSYIDNEVQKPCVGRLVRREEIYCLHFCFMSASWQSAVETNSTADYSKATQTILHAIQQTCGRDHSFRTYNDIRAVNDQWIPHFLITAAYLKLGWFDA